MKILGTGQRTAPNGYSRHDYYIVEISLEEIQKVANKATFHDIEALKKELQAGVDYPISEGYDFRGEIVKAAKDMQTAHSSFARATSTMKRFVDVMPLHEQRITIPPQTWLLPKEPPPNVLHVIESAIRAGAWSPEAQRNTYNRILLALEAGAM